jgi:hypothetical protein
MAARISWVVWTRGSFDAWTPGELPENTRDCPPSSAGFLKSRLYAKLLTGLILECYQTFNGQWVESVAGRP